MSSDLISWNAPVIPVRENVECLSRGLPKWPQMRIEGVSVSIDQAKEIIRRTDTFFKSPEWSGNDPSYCKRVMAKLGIPMGHRFGEPNIHEWERLEQWLQEWEYVGTNYVKNTWIASSFIYGPHGWCDPNGRISYIDNVGKWPSAEDIFEDWKQLAALFPFLHLICVLMDREECEDGGIPLIGFYVREGSVISFDPQVEISTELLDQIKVSRDFFDVRREQGIPWEWIEEWAVRSIQRSKDTQSFRLTYAT